MKDAGAAERNTFLLLPAAATGWIFDRTSFQERSASKTAPPELTALRDELGLLDAELVALLRRRVDLARRIGAAKRTAGLATLDTRREAQVVASAARLARTAGLAEEDVRDIFWPIMAMCRRAQQDVGL